MPQRKRRIGSENRISDGGFPNKDELCYNTQNKLGELSSRMVYSMEDHKFTLSVRNSKAIESADIVLDEITVLTGVNAAGKSTLARMVNMLVNLSQNYPMLAQKVAWKNLKDLAFQLRQFDDRMEGTDIFGSAESSGFEEFIGKRDFSDTLGKLEKFAADTLTKYVAKGSAGDELRAYMTFLRGVGIGADLASDIEKVRGVIASKIERARNEYAEICAKRDYSVYNNTTGHEIDWLVDADYVCFKEANSTVYETQRNPKPPPKAYGLSDLKEVFGIKKSFYIASPWLSVPSIDKDGVLTIPDDEFVHYPSLSEPHIDGSLFDLLKGSFDEGKDVVATGDGHNQWVYRREDGVVVKFKDCATGMKSLAILNLLYKRGYLDSETLLIIDEPEVHLHPQWVTEYAKILVQICAKLKVRMLLTSHSPDMVSALKVMAETEGVRGVNFYLAEQSVAKKYQYKYAHLGNNIERIFECFGKSIEAIDNYSHYEPK